MFINTDTSYNRISESYLKAASFDAQKEQSPEANAKAAQTVEGEQPAYVVALSADAKKLSDAEQAQKKDEDNSAKEAVQQAQEPWRKGKSQEQQKQVKAELEELKSTEREVIRHENAHKSTGGSHAGGISYDKASGPDGKQYIVGGEVSIDTSEEDTPEKTIAKMQVVKSAALAPAQPSGQDRSVAAQASRIEASARSELARQVSEKASPTGNAGKEENEIKTFKDKKAQEQEPNLGSVVDLSA